MNTATYSASHRFWAKVNKDGPLWNGTSCWLWIAGKDKDGYGKFRDARGQSVRAPRFAYELLVEPIPPGMTIDHLCRVRPCVNPSHFEVVDGPTNWRRGTAPSSFQKAGTLSRKNPSHCCNGHAFSPENIMSTKKGRRCLRCHRDQSRVNQRRYRRERAKVGMDYPSFAQAAATTRSSSVSD